MSAENNDQLLISKSQRTGDINISGNEDPVVNFVNTTDGTTSINQSRTIIYNYYYQEQTVATPTETDIEDNLVCPYQGLYHFSYENSQYFFGREVFVQELYQYTETRNVIPILGASGSGKSSVILAGLVPKLVQAGHWQFTHFRPGNDPFHALAQALIPLYEPNLTKTDLIAQARKLAGYFQDNTVSLSDVFSTIHQNHPNHRILLIADQFEEVYTLCNDEPTRRQFLDLLLTTFQSFAEQSSLSTILVSTMRADFLGNALSYRPLVDVLQNANIMLGPMNETELQDIIEKPAQKLGVSFESGLVGRILGDVDKNPGNLPLLEFALTELWKKRKGKQLTHNAYQEIGEVSGALTRYADEKFNHLKPEEQQQVRRIFVQLVRPGAGTEDTRRVATKAELNDSNWSLVKKLADARLVVTSRTVITRETSENSQQQTPIKEQETVEVVHEALIRNWGQLKQWMATDREFRTWQERLRTAMSYWQEKNRDQGLLLRGAALVQASEQLKIRRDELSEEELEFIQLSQKDQQRQRQRTIGLLTAGFVTISGIAAVAVGQWYKAGIGEQNANLRTEIVTLQARSYYSLPLQIDVIKLNQKLQQANAATLDIQLQGTDLLRQIVDWPGQKPINSLDGHESSVRGVAFSPDGKFIASGSLDKTVKLWKPDGTLLTILKGHESSVRGVAFSPDGKFIASGSWDKTVKLWKLDGTLVTTLKGHESYVSSVAFSPDGKFIASGSEDSTVKLWKLDGTLVKTLKSHEDSVSSVAFSPDGKFIASGSGDKTVKLWKLDGTLVKTFKGHEDSITGVAFSPDGKFLASGSDDKTVKLWKLDGTLVKTFKGHEYSVNSVTFSPDGKFIASGSWDSTVKLWKLDGTLVTTLTGHDNSVYSVAFSPDGKFIASGSWDKTVKLWKLDETLVTTLKGHEDSVSGVAFSPDGKFIASGSSDKTVKLWKPDGTLVTTLKGHEDYVSSVAFSPDGKFIASGSSDKTVKLWKLDGTLVTTFKGYESSAIGVAFSPDGKFIASGSGDKTVKLWKLDGTLVKTFKSHESDVFSVTFSPDGKFIASGSDDKTVKLWKLDGTLATTLKGYESSVTSIAFSPDGKFIASGSDDKTVKLWNLNRDQLINYACSWMSNYLKNNPNLEEKDRQVCGQVEPSATALFLQGEKQAAEGNINEAVSKFQQVAKLDSNLSLKVAAASLLNRGEQLAGNGKIDEAISAYNQAQELDPNLKTSASDWNQLCWQGSLNQKAETVMFACNKAVELDDKNGLIRNSRGLARALTKDFSGATEDFEIFVKSAGNAEEKAQRKAWIDALKQGKNPFTDEVLKKLRNP